MKGRRNQLEFAICRGTTLLKVGSPSRGLCSHGRRERLLIERTIRRIFLFLLLLLLLLVCLLCLLYLLLHRGEGGNAGHDTRHHTTGRDHHGHASGGGWHHHGHAGDHGHTGWCRKHRNTVHQGRRHHQVTTRTDSATGGSIHCVRKQGCNKVTTLLLGDEADDEPVSAQLKVVQQRLCQMGVLRLLEGDLRRQSPFSITSTSTRGSSSSSGRDIDLGRHLDGEQRTHLRGQMAEIVDHQLRRQVEETQATRAVGGGRRLHAVLLRLRALHLHREAGQSGAAQRQRCRQRLFAGVLHVAEALVSPAAPVLDHLDGVHRARLLEELPHLLSARLHRHVAHEHSARVSVRRLGRSSLQRRRVAAAASLLLFSCVALMRVMRVAVVRVAIIARGGRRGGIRRRGGRG
mmetsp:Transcript_38893/g.98031  ORF Transcript_38893/g.98031 Transcript_38893/m.98031 type:complete len:404 (-) Transcript_38893:8-1219(-)